MMMKYKLSSLFLLILFFSCSKKVAQIPVIDLTKVSGNYVLHLNDLLEDIRIVKIPSDNGVLIPNFYKSFVGHKYILIHAVMGSVYQYDTDGQFIRELARQGNGPGEISFVQSFDVNDDETRLYIYSANRPDQLFNYDLDNGNALPNIQLPEGRLGDFIFAGDHFIWNRNPYFGRPPVIFRDFYSVSLTGDSLETHYNRDMVEYGNGITRRAVMKRVNDHKIYYFSSLNDTLFLLDGAEKSALCFFKVDNRIDFNVEMTGHMPVVEIFSDRLFKLTNTPYNVVIDGNNSINDVKRSDYLHFLWDGKSKEATYITGYHDDFFDMEVEDFSLITWTDVAHIKYSAFEFKELLKKALSNPDVSDEKREELQLLDQGITNLDNPVFLVAKLVK